MPVQLPAVPAGAVRDTVHRLLEAREYDRALRDTLWLRVVSWLSDLFERLLDAAAGTPAGRAVALALALLAAAAVAARVFLLARARRRAAELAPPPATATELRARAHALAAQSAFAEAAHVLHTALVTRLAADRRLVADPSRTIGDHARTLRRGDQATWRAYRDFGRRYEVVLYGDGRCDATRWAELDALAAPILDAPPVAPARAA